MQSFFLLLLKKKSTKLYQIIIVRPDFRMLVPLQECPASYARNVLKPFAFFYWGAPHTSNGLHDFAMYNKHRERWNAVLVHSRPMRWKSSEDLLSHIFNFLL